MKPAEGKIADAGLEAKSYGPEALRGFMDAVEGMGNRVITLYPHPTRHKHRRTRYALGYQKGESILEQIPAV